eukprot:gene7626-9382_t
MIDIIEQLIIETLNKIKTDTKLNNRSKYLVSGFTNLKDYRDSKFSSPTTRYYINELINSSGIFEPGKSAEAKKTQFVTGFKESQFINEFSELISIYDFLKLESEISGTNTKRIKYLTTSCTTTPPPLVTYGSSSGKSNNNADDENNNSYYSNNNSDECEDQDGVFISQLSQNNSTLKRKLVEEKKPLPIQSHSRNNSSSNLSSSSMAVDESLMYLQDSVIISDEKENSHSNTPPLKKFCSNSKQSQLMSSSPLSPKSNSFMNISKQLSSSNLLSGSGEFQMPEPKLKSISPITTTTTTAATKTIKNNNNSVKTPQKISPIKYSLSSTSPISYTNNKSTKLPQQQQQQQTPTQKKMILPISQLESTSNEKPTPMDISKSPIKQPQYSSSSTTNNNNTIKKQPQQQPVGLKIPNRRILDIKLETNNTAKSLDVHPAKITNKKPSTTSNTTTFKQVKSVPPTTSTATTPSKVNAKPRATTTTSTPMSNKSKNGAITPVKKTISPKSATPKSSIIKKVVTSPTPHSSPTKPRLSTSSVTLKKPIVSTSTIHKPRLSTTPSPPSNTSTTTTTSTTNTTPLTNKFKSVSLSTTTKNKLNNNNNNSINNAKPKPRPSISSTKFVDTSISDIEFQSRIESALLAESKGQSFGGSLLLTSPEKEELEKKHSEYSPIKKSIKYYY